MLLPLRASSFSYPFPELVGLLHGGMLEYGSAFAGSVKSPGLAVGRSNDIIEFLFAKVLLVIVGAVDLTFCAKIPHIC